MVKHLLFILLVSYSLCKSQSDSVQSYFPLSIGNYWEYEITNIGDFDTSFVSYKYTEVLKDTVIGSELKSYSKLKVSFSGSPFYADTIKYYRYDSLDKAIYDYNILENEEKILFKLNPEINDCWQYFSTDICYSGADSLEIFNKRCKIKIYWKSDIPSWSYSLAQGLGPIRIIDDQSYVITNFNIYDLIYAKIEGVEYGTYVSIIDNNEQPNNYSLFQNYPNPFNPSTTINYSIPKSSRVSINIYNAIGELVKILVDEPQTFGNHFAIFNGDNLSSGIYYYRIKSGEYIETKKMVLLK